MQDENQRLQVKCSKLEERVTATETKVNSLNQWRRRNNIVVTGIPGSVQNDQLKSNVKLILSDIDVPVSIYDIEDCHQFGKPNSKSKQKTIVKMVNWRACT